jgi:hypothetical protein
MRYLALLALTAIPFTAYAGNIKDTDLISSNNFFLPPSTEKTVFKRSHFMISALASTRRAIKL